MAITTKESILKVLSAYNPWWKTGVVNPKLTKTYKRFAFYEAMKRIDQTDIRRTVVLTGTRRVGKTTIQYQMIEALLARGVPPQKIVFISMDHPMLKLSDFNDILECYHENVYAEQDVYYFFDEIQYAQDWDKWLKTIYDMQPDTQIVATGSASPALVKGNQESGAGRWSVIQVPTMSFYEYCELLNLDRPNLPKNLKVTPLLHMSQQERTRIMMQLSKVQNHFTRYLQVGGFPELALADNDIMAQQIMREDVVDKVLKRDLPSALQHPKRNRIGAHLPVSLQCIIRDRIDRGDCKGAQRRIPPDGRKLYPVPGERQSDLSELADQYGREKGPESQPEDLYCRCSDPQCRFDGRIHVDRPGADGKGGRDRRLQTCCRFLLSAGHLGGLFPRWQARERDRHRGRLPQHE